MSSSFKTSSMKNNESQSSVVPSGDSSIFRSLMMPRKWMMPKVFEDNLTSLLDTKDSNLISLKNDDTKMEISLNTSGYKPSELKVNVADGEVSIEGKHEEKTEEGHTMVLRQFSRKYALPVGAKLTEVVSNLSQDGVMVITVPKEKKIEEVRDDQKMKVEHESSMKTKDETKHSDSHVPMTMRDSFFEDPFFKDNWLDIETSQKTFIENSRKLFEESMKHFEENISEKNHNSLISNEFKLPKIIDEGSESIFSSKDSNLISTA